MIDKCPVRIINLTNKTLCVNRGFWQWLVIVRTSSSIVVYIKIISFFFNSKILSILEKAFVFGNDFSRLFFSVDRQCTLFIFNGVVFFFVNQAIFIKAIYEIFILL